MLRRIHALLLVGFCTLVPGCAQESRHLDIAGQLMQEIDSAPKRPVELSESQKMDVVLALKGSKAGAAKHFDDPDLKTEAFASFFKSPITNDVDRDRMIIVRYSDEGAYVYVGFRRNGMFFTDGTGQLYSDPPWSQ
jgi:hypothetical protein